MIKLKSPKESICEPNFQPKPLPEFPGFSKIIGPGIVWMALAQGSGELIWWPYLIAKYGTALLPLLVPSALIQLPLTYHIGKYSMLTGESIWRGFFRISKKFTFIFWLLMNFSFFWFGAFVVAGGTALTELIPLGLSPKIASTLWGYILIFTMFLILLKARKTYDIIEKFMWLVAIGTFSGLLISCFHPNVTQKFGDFLKGFFSLNIKAIDPKDYEKTITAITFMGLGGFWSLFYSYWVLDKGFGMSYFSKGEFNFGFIPSSESSVTAFRKWKIALATDSSIGTVGNLITTFMTCFLAFAILHPKAVYPEGYKIAVVQSEFFAGWFGNLGKKIFLFSSALFLIDTWITTADTLSKINIDIIKTYGAKVDEKKLYKMILTIITAITCITLPIAQPGELIVFSAMVGFVGMVIFSFLILYLIHIKLKKLLPEKVKPTKFSLALMLISSIAYLTMFILYLMAR